MKIQSLFKLLLTFGLFVLIRFASFANCGPAGQVQYITYPNGITSYTVNITGSSYQWLFYDQASNAQVTNTSTFGNILNWQLPNGNYYGYVIVQDTACSDTVYYNRIVLDSLNGCNLSGQITEQQASNGVVTLSVTFASSDTILNNYEWIINCSSPFFFLDTVTQFNYLDILLPQGVYSFGLKVETSFGCIDSFGIWPVFINPACNAISSFTYQVLSGTTVQFTNASSSTNGFTCSWIFANTSGNIGSSSSVSPSFTFTGSPTYSAFLTITDSSGGCSSSYSDTIALSGCNTTASFTYSNLGGGQVQFSNTSSSTNGYALSWTFSNSNGYLGTSGQLNPVFTFTGPQPYIATLWVNDSGGICFDSINVALILDTCHVSASFTYQNIGGGQVQFTNTSHSMHGFHSGWTFYNAGGALGTSAALNPSFTFTGSSPYRAKVTVVDSISGCIDTLVEQINTGVSVRCLTLQPDSTGDKTTQFSSGYPTNNYSTSPLIHSVRWTGGGVPVEGRSLLKFDLSQIPAGAVITSAVLSLYADTNNTNDGYLGTPTYGTDNASYLQRVTSPWTDYLVTWNNQPAATASGQVLLPQSTNNREDYPNNDVTAFVQYWLNNPLQNYGMELVMRDSSYYNSMIFCSSRYPDSTKRPKLQICYQMPCTAHPGFTCRNQGGGLAQFTNTSTSGGGYTSSWAFSNASGVIGTSAVSNPSFTYFGEPPYTATLYVNDTVNDCSDSLSQSLNLATCISLQQGPQHVANSYIFSLAPDSVIDHDSTFPAMQWTWNGVHGEMRGFIKFDLAALPANATVVSAKLSLTANDTSRLNAHIGEPTFGSNNACYLQQVTSGWMPHSVTWNTAPTTTTAGEVTLPQSTNISEDYPNIDITAFVQAWMQNPGSNYGLMLKEITNNYYNNMLFCSSGFKDSTKRPKLDICYFPAPCTAHAAFTYLTTGGGVVQFSDTSASNHGFASTWTFSNAGGVIGTSTAHNPIFTYTGEPPYNAALYVHDTVNHCTDSLLQSLNLATCISLQQGAQHVANSYIFSLAPDSVIDRDSVLPAMQWTWSGVHGEMRGLLKFDLAVLPANAVVVSAKLSLTADDTTRVSLHVGQPTFGSNNACYLQQVTSAWLPHSVTWNTAPGVTTAGEVTLPQSTNYSEDYANIDITAFVQSWMQNPGSNYGLMLREITNNYYNDMLFCSSAYHDSTKRPKLDICYLQAPCSAHAGFSYQTNGGGVVRFSDTSVSNYGYNSSWTFSNAGGVIGASSAHNPVFAYTGQPPYSARLIIKDSLYTCTDTVTEVLNISACVTLQQGPLHVTNSYIFSLTPDSNANIWHVFPAMHWTWSGVSGEVQGLMKFDLAAIPANATVISAKLSLYADDTTNISLHRGQPTFGTNNACHLQQVTSGWLPNSVTWNTAPTTTTAGQITLAQSTSYTEDYPNIDITSFAQSWMQNPSSNYGLMLKEITANYYNDMLFCSSAHPDTTRRPKLDICYFTSQCNTVASFVPQNLGNGLVVFSNTSTSISGFSSNWNFYNAGGRIGGSVSVSPQLQFTGLPPYTVTLVVTDSVSGCTDSISQAVQIGQCLTLQPGPAGDETALFNTGYPSSNFSNSPWIIADHWTGNGVPVEGRSLLNFNLSQIPAGATIVSATLSLYADTNNTNDGYLGTPMWGIDNASYLQRVTSPWSDTLMDWYLQPTTITAGEILLPQSTSYTEDYPNINVTGFVQYWANNPSQNFGMELVMRDNSYYNSMIFCSSHYPDSTKRPKLEICYVTIPLACAALFNYTPGNDSIWFNTLSTGNFNVTWNFGDGATSAQINPVHVYNQNGSYTVTLTVQDSLGSCTDSGTVFVTGVVNDSLCGLVFNDINHDGVYDLGDFPLPNHPVIIDGRTYTTDANGTYHLAVGGGVHHISTVIPSGWSETYPVTPPYYLITTTNNDIICGVDFGLKNDTASGIEDIGAENGVVIYPNPNNGTSFNVSISSGFEEPGTQVTLFDLLGKEVKPAEIQRRTGLLTVTMPDAVASGVYTLEIKNSARRWCGKVFVVR